MRNGLYNLLVAALVLTTLAGCEFLGQAQDAARSVLEEEEDDKSVPQPGQLPTGVTAQQGSEGRDLYRGACIMCHGETGQGTQLGSSVVDAEWGQAGDGSFEQIARVVTEGVGEVEGDFVPMPPRGNGTFTDGQVRAVAAYVYSLSRRGAPPPDTSAAAPAPAPPPDTAAGSTPPAQAAPAQ